MFGLDAEAGAEAFDAAASSPASTYRQIVEALGPEFEGGYFLYRFSDPTFLVADAVVPRRGPHGRSAAGARSMSAAGRVT